MTKPLHIQLLEILYKEGIGVYINVSPFFIKRFTKPLTIDTIKWREEMRRYDLLIYDLIHRGFIINQSDISSALPFEIMNNFKWFDEITVMVYITSKGIDYLDQYNASQTNIELNKSYKNVNEASLVNYRSQKYISRVTIVIALVAAGFSAADYFKSEPKMVELNKNIQGLSKEIKGIKLQIESLQNHLITPADSSRKP